MNFKNVYPLPNICPALTKLMLHGYWCGHSCADKIKPSKAVNFYKSDLDHTTTTMV